MESKTFSNMNLSTLPPPGLLLSLSPYVHLSICKRLGCICILINRLKTVFEKPKYDFFILTTYTNIEIY